MNPLQSIKERARFKYERFDLKDIKPRFNSFATGETYVPSKPVIRAGAEDHKGPPPFVGWWNASVYRFDVIWRWWDGKQWSTSAHQGSSDWEAACSASMKYQSESTIEWTDYWPKNARVPRIDPREAA